MYLFPNDFYTSLNDDELAIIKEFENTDNFGKDRLDSFYEEVKDYETKHKNLFKFSAEDLYTHKVNFGNLPRGKCLSEASDAEFYNGCIKPILDNYPYEFLMSPFFILNELEGTSWYVYDCYTNSFLSEHLATKEITAIPFSRFCCANLIGSEVHNHTRYRYDGNNNLQFDCECDPYGRSVAPSYLLVVDSSKPYWEFYKKLFSKELRINYSSTITSEGAFLLLDWTSDSNFKGFEKATFELESLLNYYKLYKQELSSEGQFALRHDIKKAAHTLLIIADHLSPHLIGNSAPLFTLGVFAYMDNILKDNF